MHVLSNFVTKTFALIKVDQRGILIEQFLHAARFCTQCTSWSYKRSSLNFALTCLVATLGSIIKVI